MEPHTTNEAFVEYLIVKMDKEKRNKKGLYIGKDKENSLLGDICMRRFLVWHTV